MHKNTPEINGNSAGIQPPLFYWLLPVIA